MRRSSARLRAPRPSPPVGSRPRAPTRSSRPPSARLLGSRAAWRCPRSSRSGSCSLRRRRWPRRRTVGSGITGWPGPGKGCVSPRPLRRRLWGRGGLQHFPVWRAYHAVQAVGRRPLGAGRREQPPLAALHSSVGKWSAARTEGRAGNGAAASGGF